MDSGIRLLYFLTFFNHSLNQLLTVVNLPSTCVTSCRQRGTRYGRLLSVRVMEWGYGMYSVPTLLVLLIKIRPTKPNHVPYPAPMLNFPAVAARPKNKHFGFLPCICSLSGMSNLVLHLSGKTFLRCHNDSFNSSLMVPYCFNHLVRFFLLSLYNKLE